MNWLALYTKSRHEKSIHLHLEKMRIESFLPLRHIKRRWSDRTVTVEEPLFKSYVFVRTDTNHRRDVLQSKGAVKFISVGGTPIAIEDTVIDSLRSFVNEAIAADPFPYLHPGDRVKVQKGVFKGIEGFIMRKDDKKCRLVIVVDAIQTSIALEVDSCLVERV